MVITSGLGGLVNVVVVNLLDDRGLVVVNGFDGCSFGRFLLLSFRLLQILHHHQIYDKVFFVNNRTSTTAISMNFKAIYRGFYLLLLSLLSSVSDDYILSMRRMMKKD